MSVPRDRFREGFVWDDWLDRLGPAGREWRRRFDRAALGRLRAEYENVPAPRYVLCLFDPASPAALEAVPLVAKACDQAGLGGGVELRLFPAGEHPGLADQYLAGAGRSLPACVVFDRDWIQVGVWWLRSDPREDPGWRDRALGELLEALRGQPSRPWQGHRHFAEHRGKQAEQAPGGA